MAAAAGPGPAPHVGERLDLAQLPKQGEGSSEFLGILALYMSGLSVVVMSHVLLNDHLFALRTKVNAASWQADRLESRMGHLESRMERLESQVGSRVEHLGSRMDQRMDQLGRKIDTMTRVV